MAHHIGVDIIEIARIKQAIARRGERFLHRVYTDPEISLYGRNPASLAARFACKEAVVKLLDRKDISWREIETLSRPGGKPFLNLYGRAQAEAKRLGLKEIAVSLSHSKEYAIAAVAGTSETGLSQ